MKTKLLMSRLLLTLVFVSSTVSSFAQTCVPAANIAGTLDTCFGTNGKVTTQVSAGTDVARSVVVQLDGKIVVAGFTDWYGSPDFAVVRYNPDGSLDTSFDGDGKVTTDFSGHSDFGRSVKLQRDGKIVLAGTSDQFYAVARYNPDGSLDNSFDGDGKVLTDIGSPVYDIFNSMELQPDGKIVLGGGGSFFRYIRFPPVVVRYNTDGSLDSSFGSGGQVVIKNIRYAAGVAIQNDGKILTVGGVNYELVVVRFNTDGSLDNTFGESGIATFVNPDFYDLGFSIKLQPNGKILAGGGTGFSPNDTRCGLIVRFDTNGMTETNFTNCANGTSDFFVQPDGKILTAGFNSNNLATGFQITRFGYTGALDNLFNGNGFLLLGFESADLTAAYSVIMQRDNKILAVGLAESHFNGSRIGKFAITRINSGLAAPRSAPFDFDGDRKADISVFRPSSGIWQILQSSNQNTAGHHFGATGDLLTPSDYDGDGQTDVGIFRPSTGEWWIKNSRTNTVVTLRWGQTGDIPRPSDFDGDGKADLIVYRPSNNIWYRMGSTGAPSIATFGSANDKPLIGDFDGDGKSDLIVYRPSTGDWWRQSSLDQSTSVVHWGFSTDMPVPADYDGDGKTDFAVYRNGVWYISKSGDGQTVIYHFGLAGDKPVTADYDGDGKDDVALYRPSNGVWYLLRSTGGFAALQFGNATDVAVSGEALP